MRNVRGEWREIAMSKHIKALVVLNLQSYAGGRDLWGLRDPKRDAAKGWQTPIFNDGLIEVRRAIGAAGTAHPMPAWCRKELACLWQRGLLKPAQ